MERNCTVYSCSNAAGGRLYMVVTYFNLLPFFSYCKVTLVPLEWSIQCIRTLPMVVVLCCVCLFVLCIWWFCFSRLGTTIYSLNDGSYSSLPHSIVSSYLLMEGVRDSEVTSKLHLALNAYT